jgi:hypothetical protein
VGGGGGQWVGTGHVHLTMHCGRQDGPCCVWLVCVRCAWQVRAGLVVWGRGEGQRVVDRGCNWVRLGLGWAEMR